ncbi:MAG: glycosyltransferase family 2 protein [Pseudomonadota bacterium]
MNENKKNPFFSIVTVTLNNADGLLATIHSIKNQNIKDFEFIVIDGKSTDNTLSYIDKNNDFINKWISEKDDGIYHAMNKGINLCSGEYILFLNSGDTFTESNVLNEVKSKITNPKKHIYYTRYKINNKKIDQNMSLMQLTRKMICHQTIFYASHFLKSNPFNEEMRYAADYEHLLRNYRKITHGKIETYLVNYDPNGLSSNSNNYGKIWAERALGLRKSDINPVIKFLMLAYALIAVFFRSK